LFAAARGQRQQGEGGKDESYDFFRGHELFLMREQK
jgi:hypothetical protein